MGHTRRLQATAEAVGELQEAFKGPVELDVYQYGTAMQSRQTLQLLTGLSGDSNQSAFFNVRRMPSRNLSYDHKHLDCSVNHRGC